MKAAIELARRILSKEEAIRKTKTWTVKRDLQKSVLDDKNELLYYCRNRGFTIDKVFKEAKKPLQIGTNKGKMDRKGGKSMKEELLNYRKQNGISQRKMAKLCGISPTTIERIEKGGEPSMIVAGKLERIINNKQEETK